MATLSLTSAIDIIKGAREKFGVELKPHSPCGAKGFFLTTENPSPELTEFVRNAFREKGAEITVDEKQEIFMYKF